MASAVLRTQYRLKDVHWYQPVPGMHEEIVVEYGSDNTEHLACQGDVFHPAGMKLPAAPRMPTAAYRTSKCHGASCPDGQAQLVPAEQL